ncbi:MAG: hypothetical protein QHH14_13975 [Clostridiales bacterium]|nr:hypothetical protein [Clostridiales bacterium]
MKQKVIKVFFFLTIITANIIQCRNYSPSSSTKITYLEKIKEIKNYSEEDSCFDKITSLCVDSENRLYVADSGLSRIFVFTSDLNYLDSFSGIGQPSEEFSDNLLLSCGSCGKLYVTNLRNHTLSTFSLDGQFIRQFSIDAKLLDVPLINSKGDIYFLSLNGTNILDIFDSELRLKDSLIDMKFHLTFPFESPQNMARRMMSLFPTINQVKKLITRDDQIFILLNNSQTVLHIDEGHKLINSFSVHHPRFVKDYRQRLKNIVGKGGWINCFGSFYLDECGYLCLCYYNRTADEPEIYRYSTNGNFIDILKIRENGQLEPTNQFISASSSVGLYYSISLDSKKICAYKIVE